MQQKAVKRFAAAGLALVLCAAFSACGQKQGTLTGFEWAIEPQYEFEKVEPVLDSASMLEGTVCTEEGQAGFYLAETDEGWSVLNTATGELALEDFFIRRPVRCWMGHLYDEALYDAGRRYTNEQEMNYNRELAQIGSRFTLEIGHGGIMCQYLLEPDEGTVCLVSISDGISSFTPVAQTDKAFRGLLPVSKGEWREEEIWEEIELERQPGSLYAVASPQGELLTDFVYDAAGMAGPELIAVQKGGRWGYVNDKGEEIIPCEYEGFWGAAGVWDGAAERYVYGQIGRAHV